jgi:hypothetical protein
LLGAFSGIVEAPGEPPEGGSTELELVVDVVAFELSSRESIRRSRWPGSADPNAPTPLMDMGVIH